MKKVYGSFMMLTMLGLMMAGCNSSSGSGSGLGPVDMASLVGKWRIETMKQTGTMRVTTTTPPHDTTTSLNDSASYTDSTYFVQFNADLTFFSNDPDERLPKSRKLGAILMGTWSLSGSTLTTIFRSDSEEPGSDTVKAEVGISGNKLTSISRIVTSNSYSGSTISSDITYTYVSVKM
jgi:hypothetical protein